MTYSKYKYLVAFLLLMLLSPVAISAEEETPPVIKPTFDSLLESADLVALAQLNYTRYERIRGFPSGGEAWLQAILIYKSAIEVDTIVVYDQGLKGDHCYFPPTDLWQEGDRFLVFLKHEENMMYRGLTPVCYLPVSVASNNQYILRLPADNIQLPAALLQQVKNYKFLDAGSRIDATDLNRPERAELVLDNTMIDEGDTLVYTQGIPISAVRQYIRSQLPK